MEKARGEFLTAIEQRASDTRRMAMLSLYETLYAGHPLAISGLGYEDSMRALTRDDLVRFYETHYQPQGMTFSIVGAVRKEEALAAVERVLGDWRPPARPDRAFPAVQRPTEIRRQETQIADKSQADLVFGWVGLERAHPDYMAARLANSVLGVFGIMGRIGHSVREEQGLAYYAYSHLVASFCPGPWMAIAGVNPRNIDKAAESILKEVRRLRDELVPRG